MGQKTILRPVQRKFLELAVLEPYLLKNYYWTGGTVLYTTSTIPLTVGTTTIASGTNGRLLYDNSGVLGEISNGTSGYLLGTNGTTPSWVGFVQPYGDAVKIVTQGVVTHQESRRRASEVQV